MSRRIAVVDGDNIAYIEKSNQGDLRISNTLSVRSLLKEKGHEPIIIVDANLLYEIDDRTQLESLIDEKMGGMCQLKRAQITSLLQRQNDLMDSLSLMTYTSPIWTIPMDR